MSVICTEKNTVGYVPQYKTRKRSSSILLKQVDMQTVPPTATIDDEVYVTEMAQALWN